jgi:hypothetical protein
MKSTDGGATWSTVFPTTAAIFTIIIDSGNPDVLYAPTVGHGAFKSTDGGLHWSAMAALAPQAIWTMALDPVNSQVLYAGTNQDGVWKSTTQELPGSRQDQMGHSLCTRWPSMGSTHIVYAGTNGGGVWTSDGGGTRSTSVADGMVLSLAVDSAGAVYAGTNFAGAKVSHDHGATWTTLNTGVDRENKSGYGIWVDPKDNQKMFLGNEAQWGLVWSQDGGAGWSAAGQGFTGRGSRGMAFDPTDSGRVYAGAMIGDGFFKSTDGGQTWSVRRFGSPAVYVISVAVDPYRAWSTRAPKMRGCSRAHRLWGDLEIDWHGVVGRDYVFDPRSKQKRKNFRLHWNCILSFRRRRTNPNQRGYGGVRQKVAGGEPNLLILLALCLCGAVPGQTPDFGGLLPYLL